MIDEAALGGGRRRDVHRRPAALDGAVEGGGRPPRPPRGHLGLRPGRRRPSWSASPPWSGGGSTPCRAPPRPRLPPRAAPVPAGALAVSLPEACRLSDALAASLRARLGIDPSEADLQARLRALRASVERVRDLVDREPAQAPRRGLVGARPARPPHRRRARQGQARRRRRRPPRARWSRTPPAPSATSSSVPSNRRADAHDEARARALRVELEARGAALRDLAARCVAQVAPAPRLAVPDVSALGPVPTDPAAVDAYLVRLDAVGPGDDDGPGRLRLGAVRARRAADDAGGVCRQGRRPARAPPARPQADADLAELDDGPARPSTGSRPTWCVAAPSSPPTWPTWAAPGTSRHAPTPRRREAHHEHDRLHPARVHREPSSTATATSAGHPAPGAATAPPADGVRRRPRPSAGWPAGAPSRAAPARWSTATATSAGRPARRARSPAGRRAAPGRPRPGLGRDVPAGIGPVAVDRVAGVQPARVDGPRLGARDRRRQQGHPAGRHVLDPAAWGPARRGPDLHPAGAGGRRRQGGAEEPDGAGGPAHLPLVRVAGGPLARRPARAHRGLLPDLPQPVLLHAQAAGG